MWPGQLSPVPGMGQLEPSTQVDGRPTRLLGGRGCLKARLLDQAKQPHSHFDGRRPLNAQATPRRKERPWTVFKKGRQGDSNPHTHI